MQKKEIEARLQELREEEAKLRRHLGELEGIAQAAPGSHSPGVPSAEAIEVERQIRTVVLQLSDIDRKRQALTVAMSAGG